MTQFRRLNAVAPRRLVLFSSSFPFGRGEPFLAAEFPYLEEAFDEIVIVSNDATSPQTRRIGPKVRCERLPYSLSATEKLLALQGIFDPEVLQELRACRRRYPRISLGRTVAAVLSSWQNARRFRRWMRRIASERPDCPLYAYSYWANDMAVAAATARAAGYVRWAITRAHGWDVYASRPEVGLLPFRDYLARHLDAVLFVSEDGRRVFESTIHDGRARREVVRLGTVPLAERPQGRGESFTIVSCSALIPLKRIELLARAVVASGLTVRWTHVGDGPERNRIEGICSRAPNTVRVALTGHLAAEEVVETWRGLRPSALINVSSSEGVPVSMMEAMSLGIPVIGTNVGGVGEIVTHGVNGLLLSKDPTQDEIVAALRLFSRLSEAEFDRLADGAWRAWDNEFRADSNFRRLVSMLDPAGDNDTVVPSVATLP